MEFFEITIVAGRNLAAADDNGTMISFLFFN
jgi:hypothetical protein